MNDDFLRVYLNDHRAGAQGGLQLAQDCLKRNPTGPLSVFLSELIDEIKEEISVLDGLIDQIKGSENPLKKAASHLMSKASTLKFEHLFGSYSDLSRLEELEGLALGVWGKHKLWAALEAVSGSEERFSDVDFAALRERAQRQHEQLEGFRLQAAQKAFAQPKGAASGS